ncbi:MAG: GIY-YIG nuclease family protein [Patescibacteria group bacterium]
MLINDFKQINKLPDAPGVYQFKKNGKILYIGKATSLRERVRSYFSKDLTETRGALIEKMVKEAEAVDFKKTDSVLEALILEANLVKKYKPPYNTELKDDKSFNWVVITAEEYPRVLVARERDLKKTWEPEDIRYQFGPYPNGLQLKEALRIIRKIFPFSDKCRPGALRPCFDAELGTCPGVCVGGISKQDYTRLINHIRLFFEGKKDKLIKKLEKEMKEYARYEKFEKAQVAKKTIFALKHIKDVSLIKREESVVGVRIESYDVAHISETARVGVMVVIEDGMPKKSDYRKFSIKTSKAGDTSAIGEVLERRLVHSEWPLPKLFVVDGGKQQRNAFINVLQNAGIEIPVVSVVKNERHQPREILGDMKIRRRYENDIILANSEAHRFAIAYHKKKRAKI